MSVRVDLRAAERDLRAAGYLPLHRSESHAVYYRYIDGGVREEVSLLFDRGGRLGCWSVWHNQRVKIEGGTGRRDRLRAHLAGEGTP